MLGVARAGQIDLDGRVDRDDVVVLSDDARIVDVVDGPALDRANELWAAGGSRTDPPIPPAPPTAEAQQLQRDYFWPQVFDASGRSVQLSMWGITLTKPAAGEVTAFIPGPGRYRIQLGDALAADDQQRWIVVP